MNKKHLLSIGILCLMSFGTFAQNVFKGTVVEQASGEGLPGVSVIIKGTSTGTSTDFDGNFEIMSDNDEIVLIFSYVGFKTVEQAALANQSFSISLEDDAQALNEVVVVGYGTARKKDLTGSVELMTEKTFNDGPTSNAAQLIQGKVAGVNITPGSGAPGSGNTIRIRGTGSLNITSNPLIVVDGVPLSDDNIGGSRNALNNINPNDIATITVLKDASSTAIYGSRAANGVILITTKKGRAGQDIKVSINTVTGVSTVNNYVDAMNADQYRTLINGVDAEKGTDYSSLLGNSSNHWQSLIYQNAINSDNSVSVSGSTKSVPWRISVGYTNTEGILKTDEFNRTTAKLNLNPSFLDNRLKFDINLNGSFIKNQFANTDAIGAAVQYDPTQAVYDPTSPYGGYSYWREDPTDPNSTRANLASTNPLALLNLKDDSSNANRFISNAKIDYQFKNFSELVATLNVGYDYSSGTGNIFTSNQMPDAREDYNGYESTYDNENINQLLDFYLNYNKDLDQNNTIGAMLGYSYQSFYFFTETQSVDKKTDPNNNIENHIIDKRRDVLASFFGRFNYSFSDKYLVTATVRADGSSKLNPDDRWGIFPSVALAWNMSNEEFLEDSDIVNNLKVRLGYGQVGNVNGLDSYQFLTRYQGSQNGANYGFGNQYYPTYRPEPINENLKWEVGNTINFGIDYGLYNSRVYGSLDIYSKTTTDLIASSTVDPFTNFGNEIIANIGDMRNRGVEFALNVVPVKTDNLEWTINTNITYNENEVTKMPTVQNVGGVAGGTGNFVQRHQEGYAPFSFYVYEQVYDENNKPIEGVFVDRNNDGAITEDDRYFYKDPYADVVIGINTNLTYKSWDFAFVSRLSLGNYTYNNVASDKGYAAFATQNPKTLNNLSTSYFDTNFQLNNPKTLVSDYFVTNSSFYKIDNITLGYTFPRSWMNDMSLRVYGAANNIAIISDYSGIDPEISGGIDNDFYPRPQVYSLGLSLNF